MLRLDARDSQQYHLVIFNGKSETPLLPFLYNNADITLNLPAY